MKRVALVGLLLWSSAVAGDVKILNDVSYGAGPAQVLDAYLPESARSTPALVFIHGGGWRRGDKKSVRPVLKQELLDANVAIISINYRLSGEATWPAQGDDVTRAMQFVRFHAGEWRINPRRIAVMGGSAGAHLALWIGLHDDRANPRSADPVKRQSTRVCAIVNYFGPTDFHLLTKIKHFHPAYLQLFGFKEGDPPTSITSAQMDDVSPITYVSPDDPPVFTAHGTGDTTVPVEHARLLVAKLKKNGVPTETYLLEGGKHGLGNPLPSWPDYQKATVEFLKKYLLR
jgi:acetyl esterase/lipase